MKATPSSIRAAIGGIVLLAEGLAVKLGSPTMR